MEKKNKAIFMVGLPGAGKSTFAKELASKEEYIIHSSDKIREELGDVNDQSRNEEVFKILHSRVVADLKAGKNIIYDSCGVKRKDRLAFLHLISNIDCYKECVLIATPYEYCLAQNFARDRQVPEEVICRFYKNFQMPCKEEGFDNVIVHYNKEEWKSYYGNVVDYVESLMEFPQDNNHHTLSLGKHMEESFLYLVRHYGSDTRSEVLLAAYSHDIGKPSTKSFKNGKGEITKEAHYYSHHNVGAYNSMFFEYDNIVSKEYIALLIELHMKPYLDWKQSEKAKKKDIAMFGLKIYNDVMKINEADINAK